MLAAAVVAPATAGAVDDPSSEATTPLTIPSTEDPGTTDPVPVTIDPGQLEAMQEQAASQDEDRNVFEKASDFVTDNAPWFIIGIIVLAAIVAGILIMRGRPQKAGNAARPANGRGGDAAATPSAAELRRRKRAAAQRQREEERMRRKAGMEGRRNMPAAAPPVAAAATSGAYVDPIEAEKQAARDQQTAAGAMARLGGGTVPAPVSPSQTAPAAGVVTPGMPVPDAPAEPALTEPDTTYQPAPVYPESVGSEPGSTPEAETGILLPEPALEAPGPDGIVGDAAGAFLAAGAGGAAGGFAAARANRPDPAPAEEPAEPLVAPEPGMAAEHAVADPEPVAPDPVAPEAAAAAADDRLRAKVAEIKAAQGPARPQPDPEPEPEVTEPVTPAEPDVDLSPGLASVERKLSANRDERDRVLRDAEDRLRRIEQRAEDAERRAAFAERLAQLKIEESDRERRLNDVVSGIDRAEQRALEAEARAEAAEKAAAAALERSDLQVPAAEIPDEGPPAAQPVTEAVIESTPEPEAVEPEPVLPPRRGLFSPENTPSPARPDTVNLNQATFEELREAGLSVTQATRILAYRERFGGYSSVEDLEKVPGFPADLIESLRSRLSI